MKRLNLFVFAFFCVAMFAPLGLAQQTVNVTDGLNSFVWTVDETANVTQTFSAANSGIFFPTDILFEEGWFLIINGQATRLAETDSGSIITSGSGTPSATISYSNVQAAGELFDIDLNYQVGTAPTGVIDLDIGVELSLQGNSALPVSGSLVNYFDYDINGSQAQKAVFRDTPVATIRQWNPVTGEGFSRVGVGASAFDIASYNTLLSGIEAGTLLDSTPDLGTIDVTAAFQWDFTIGVGAGTGGPISFTAGGFAEVGVPEPSALSMVSLLGVMISLKRSRSRC